MPVNDITDQKALSRHLDAIPMIPAKPGDGFDMLMVSVVETANKYDCIGHSFLPTRVGYLNRDYVKETDVPFAESIKNLVAEDFPDFVAAAGQCFDLGLSAGATASGIELEIDVGTNASETKGLLLLDCKAQDCTHVRGLIDFLKNTVQAICDAPKLQSFLAPHSGSYPGSRRVLLAVVVRAITGLQQKTEFKESSSKDKLKINVPAICGAGVSGEHKQGETETAIQRGTIGVAMAFLQLEFTAASNSVKVQPSVPIIQRVDEPQFEMALSWKKMPRFLKRFERRDQAGLSFVLGETLECDDDMSGFDSYRTAREIAGEGAPGNLTDEGSNGHVMLRGEPLYSPQRMMRGEDIHYKGSMNFLYGASVSELEDIYGKIKRGEKVEIKDYHVVSVTPAIPFDDSDFIPIHYTVKVGDTADDLPGAILRYEGDVKVLITIDPLGNGKNSKEAITPFSSLGWEVQESVLYVHVDDSTRKMDLEQAGYHQLADSEAYMDDVRSLNLQDNAFIVMGRHELVSVVRSSKDVHDLAREESLEGDEGSASAKKLEEKTFSTVATGGSGFL